MSSGEHHRWWLAITVAGSVFLAGGGAVGRWSSEALAKPESDERVAPQSTVAPKEGGVEKSSSVSAAGAEVRTEDIREAGELGAELANVQERTYDLRSMAEEEYLHSAQERADAKKELKVLDKTLDGLEAQLKSAEARLERWGAAEYMRMDDTRLGDPLLGRDLEDGAARSVYVDAAVGRDVRILEELRILRGERDAVRNQIEEARKRVAELDRVVEAARDRALEAARPGEDQRVESVIDPETARRAIDYPKGTPEEVKKVIEGALNQVGVPYVFAGETPGVGFDCSGLTKWAWGLAGVELSHSSRYQQQSVRRVSREDLRIGDLVFYGSPVHHVEIYLGNDMVVGAPNTGKSVRVSSINAWRGLRTYGRVELPERITETDPRNRDR